MSWLASSAEGKRVFGQGVASLLAALVVLALAVVGVALYAEQDRALVEQGSVLASILDRSVDTQRVAEVLAAQAARPDGTHADAFVVGPDGRVQASTRPEDVGQPSDGVEARNRSAWPGGASYRRALQMGGRTLVLMAPLTITPATVRPLLPGVAVGLPIALLFGLPFLLMLSRRWMGPIHQVLAANRDRGADGRGAGAPLASSAVPAGPMRELVAHRSQVLEALQSREDALSRRTGEMEILFEFSRQIGLSKEPPDVPRLALSFLSRSVDYDVGCVLVFSEEQHNLTVCSRAPMSELVSADVERLAVESHFEKSGVLLEGEKLETSQIVIDVRAQRLDGRFRSAHWVPITLERKQVGVMGVLALSERHFGPDALRFLNLLAQNASLCLEKLHIMRVEETQRFRNVLENLAEGVVLLRQGGEWALATGPARSFHAEICGPEATGTVAHSHQCPIGLLGLDVFHGGQAITREITRHERTFILNGIFVRSGAAGEQGAVISIRDVTEERATQQQLFQASKLASLGELAAGVAHEVNNPLTGILGFTELLIQRDDITPPVLEGLQDIHSLARRTAQITMDLLIFARVQREGGFQAVDLRAVVRDTVKLLETTYRNLNLEVIVEMGDPSEPLVAVGDHGKLQQITLNLAQNAKDAITMAGHGSRIIFRGFRQKDEVVLEVEDDGPGIPDRIRARIFEPFYTTKPVGKGTGLGLAIVNRIVEEHKGKLLVDTDESRGTRFRICLPAASQEAVDRMVEARAAAAVEAAAHPTRTGGGPVPGLASPRATPHLPLAPTLPASPTSPLRGAADAADVVRPVSGAPVPSGSTSRGNGDAASSRGCIVILDDEDTVLKFVTRTLERDGIAVHATTDPTRALELIAGHHPDLLFLDFRMPEVSGEEFYHQVMSREPVLAGRVVFLTGDATGDEIQGFLKASGATALTKPIGIRELRDFVDRRLAEMRQA